MMEVITKVQNELEKLGLKMEDVANEHIIEACTAKVALEDNLNKEGINFDEIEQKVLPDSTFINKMVEHLDNGGKGEDMISEFIFGAIYYSPELKEALFEEE